MDARLRGHDVLFSRLQRRVIMDGVFADYSSALLILFLGVGYLIGSIPFGLILTRLAGYGDIRKIGSGNIGATNVLRTGNKPLALLTLILDSGKGAGAVLITFFTFSDIAMMLAGFGAILGHMFPIWLGFKGGKGVATTLGTMLALSPYLGGSMCLIWLITAAISRISSLAALTAFLLAPVLAYIWLMDMNLAILSLVVTVLVFWKHKDNIVRLIKGKEPRIGQKR